MVYRAAIYFTPDSSGGLATAARSWLGRDPWGQDAGQSPLPVELRSMVEQPARYGFHATIKAPFRLADGMTIDDVCAAVDYLCHRSEPIPLGTLQVSMLSQFLALTAPNAADALVVFAGKAVRALDYLRAPLTDAERQKRTRQISDETERVYFEQWGYPYVFDRFRFHMTLTGPLESEQIAHLKTRAQEHFRACLADQTLDALSVLVEEEPGEPFRGIHRTPLTAAQPAQFLEEADRRAQ